MRFIGKKIKAKLYFAKMNEDIIILKRDGEDSIKISWNEVASISRLRLTNPALYIMTPIKSKGQVYIFPTSAHLLTFSFSINGFGIQRDFSKMGKHIRKIKKKKNLKSFYFFTLKEIIKKPISLKNN